MVFHEQPTDPWTPTDFKLIEAYQILDQETCNECGNPLWLCRSENPDLLFEVSTSVCNGKVALEKWHEEDGKKKKKEKGVIPSAVPYVLRWEDKQPVKDYDHLPTRTDFYEERQKDEGDNG